MKRPLLLLLALPLCAFGAAKPADAQENFISNGSFDSRSGWSDDGTVSSDSDDKQNGFYVVRLGLKEKSFSTKIKLPKTKKPMQLTFRVRPSAQFELANPSYPDAFSLVLKPRIQRESGNGPLGKSAEVIDERGQWKEITVPVETRRETECELIVTVPAGKGEIAFDDFSLVYDVKGEEDEDEDEEKSSSKKEDNTRPPSADVYRSENILPNGNFASVHHWRGDGKIITDPKDQNRIYTLSMRGSEQSLFRRQTFTLKDSKKLYELTFRTRVIADDAAAVKEGKYFQISQEQYTPKRGSYRKTNTLSPKITELDKWVGVRYRINTSQLLDFYLEVTAAPFKGIIDFDDFVLREVDPAKFKAEDGVFEWP